MKKFIARGWGDGTDFIGTNMFRSTNIKADRRGFGDMICEVSNLYAQANEADILIPSIHHGLNNFIKLVDMNNRNYQWNNNKALFHKFLSQSTNNESLAKVSERDILHCYPDFEYVQLVSERFIKTDIPMGIYGTIQELPLAKKCEYGRTHIHEAFLEAQKQYDFPLISVAGLEKLGLAKLAYIIKHAVVHVGVDSGMSHFALTIKNKNDVHLYVPKDRITGVTHRWIRDGYNVNFLK